MKNSSVFYMIFTLFFTSCTVKEAPNYKRKKVPIQNCINDCIDNHFRTTHEPFTGGALEVLRDICTKRDDECFIIYKGHYDIYRYGHQLKEDK